MFSCYYLYTFHKKDFIIMSNIVINNFNIFVKNALTQLIIINNMVINNFNIFVKNASTQLIIIKDKLIKFLLVETK